MKKELLQQVLDALENSSDLVFKDLSKSYLRELAVNTLREAIAQPEQPAAPVAPIPALPTPWHHRILKVHPKSEPEFWPDELRIKYMADEISELRAAVTLQFTPPVVQAEPDRAPLVRFNLDCHFEGMDQRREFVMASDHDARVHDLETLCDPAGIVVENALLKHQTRELVAMIERLKREAAQPIGGEVTDADSRDAGQAEGGAA